MCTLIMATDQKLLDLVGSLLQMIARTQENLGEMLKIQKRQNEMNNQILQDSIGLEREVERKMDQQWDIHPSDPLRNGPCMKTQRKLSR